jgi:hypothetical protein
MMMRDSAQDTNKEFPCCPRSWSPKLKAEKTGLTSIPLPLPAQMVAKLETEKREAQAAASAAAAERTALADRLAAAKACELDAMAHAEALAGGLDRAETRVKELEAERDTLNGERARMLGVGRLLLERLTAAQEEVRCSHLNAQSFRSHQLTFAMLR